MLLSEPYRGGTTIFLSSHLLAEVEQLCTRIGLLDRGRLVLQDELVDPAAPTGRIVVRHPGRRAPRGPRRPVEHRDGDRLLVRGSDAAQLNARLVAAGIAVLELGPERRTLEDVIAERTSARTARTRCPGDPRRARQAAPAGAAPGWRSRCSTCCPPSCRCCSHDRDRAATGSGPALPVAVLANGSLFSIAALAIVLPLFLPMSVAVVAGEAVAGEAQAGTLRYLLVRPVGRTRLLVPKLWPRRSSCSSRW